MARHRRRALNPGTVGAVRAALLDVNETLVDLSGLRPAFASLGIPDALPLWFARTLRTGFALAAAGDYRPFRDVASAALVELDPERLTPADSDAVLTAFAGLRLHPDVGEGLAMLREAGIPAMTLSVGDASVVRAIVDRAGLGDLVDDHLSVDAVRRWKPAPEAYRYGCQRLGVEPAEVAMIAAHSWDLHGARRAGLRTGWVSRLERRRPAVFDPADAQGPDLPAVVTALLAGKNAGS